MASQLVVNGRFAGRQLNGVVRYASEILRCWGADLELLKPPQPLSGLQGQAWEQLVLPGLVGPERVLWSPANTGPLMLPRQVVTIHDLSPLEHPEWFAPAFHYWYRFLLPQLVQRAAAVLTVSETSRRSILKRFNLEPERVTSIPGGVNLRQFHPGDPTPVRQKYRLPERYVLYVGSLDLRKNIERLFQAWVRLGEFRDVELVIAGSAAGPYRPAPIASARRRTRLLGFVPDEDLPGLYAGATVFIMPSLFESFGLAVLEAMACGTPVITSSAGALPEVVGQAAIQVDPTSAEGMAEAIRNLLLDEEQRRQLRQKGLERACQFSWERSAQQIREVMTAHA